MLVPLQAGGAGRGEGSLLTYFRKGKLHKFFITDKNATKELDFLDSAKILESQIETKREKIEREFYNFLEKNKEALKEATQEYESELPSKGGKDNTIKILRILKSKTVKNYQGFTEDDDQYIQKVIKLLEDGALPKQTTKTVASALNGIDEPLKILAKIKTNIPEEFLTEHISQSSADIFGPREVILSEYLLIHGFSRGNSGRTN